MSNTTLYKLIAMARKSGVKLTLEMIGNLEHASNEPDSERAREFMKLFYKLTASEFGRFTLTDEEREKYLYD